jgi:hypothetical protein
MTALTAEALQLSPQERLKSESEELERRRKGYSANPESLIDWSELKLRLLKRQDDAH